MITKKQLRETVARLQRKGADIGIHYAYGRPRCTRRDEGRELSPRLFRKEMAIWLDGYEVGYDEERQNK